ncbi:hypothetical protein Leryth_011453 [Lithospermum erythrorhizon]|nr:hypothetical protein Leryth_011453 [Lithospermum erythrorhizon]
MGMNIFDNVKYEKEKAMKRFIKFQQMKKILKVLEFVFVLCLLSWSTKKIIPSMVGFSNMVFEVFVSFLNPHFVFLIGNSIILSLFLLCNQHGQGNSSGDGNNINIYHEYSCSSETSTLTSEVPLTSSGVVPKVVEEEEMNKRVVESVQCEEVEVALAAAEHEIKRFQRTFSEKLKREIGVRGKKELRRSETENGRGGGGGGSGEGRVVGSLVKTVEHLSNEEFKLVIDDFIDKHRAFSKEPAHLRYK